MVVDAGEGKQVEYQCRRRALIQVRGSASGRSASNATGEGAMFSRSAVDPGSAEPDPSAPMPWRRSEVGAEFKFISLPAGGGN